MAIFDVNGSSSYVGYKIMGVLVLYEAFWVDKGDFSNLFRRCFLCSNVVLCSIFLKSFFACCYKAFLTLVRRRTIINKSPAPY